jgi:hypothetical protein
MARKRSTWNQIQRDLYLTQRTMSDVSAARRGRLGKRLLRRYTVRSLFRALSR